MSIEEGLRTELLADAATLAIISTRIHPSVIPQGGALPAIVYNRVSSERTVDLDGPSDFVKVRIRVDCWHNTYAGVKALADAVRAALNGVGLASPKTLGAEPVQLVYLDSDGDNDPAPSGDRQDRRVTQDWIIIHLET